MSEIEMQIICFDKANYLLNRQRLMRTDVRQVLEHYPRIYFACHARHRRDPETQATLSAHQASILDHLDAVEPTTVTDLAGHMGVTLSTMSIAIGRLERSGYVSRERDPNDGRRIQVRLTKPGTRMKEAQSVLEPERVALMLDRLTADERGSALRGLELLARAANEEIASWKEKRSQDREPNLGGKK